MSVEWMADEFFWRHVEFGENCWLWTGAKRSRGYGNVGRKAGGRQRNAGAHRVAYEAIVGPVPEGLVLDHLCRNTLCVRPDHLEPVTTRENLLRGVSPSAERARQTHCREGHPLSGANLAFERGGRSRRCLKCRQRNEQMRTPRRRCAVCHKKRVAPCCGGPLREWEG